MSRPARAAMSVTVVWEDFVADLASRGVRSSIVRLTPTVHSSLDHHGFIAVLIAAARQNGYAAYVGEGANRWPAVHTLDAANLYRLALEKAPAGSRLHAVADEGVPFADIAATIGHNLGLPVRSISPEEADDYFGFLGFFAQMDNPATAVITRELLGWNPTHPGLIADLDEGHYFGHEPPPPLTPRFAQRSAGRPALIGHAAVVGGSVSLATFDARWRGTTASRPV